MVEEASESWSSTAPKVSHYFLCAAVVRSVVRGLFSDSIFGRHCICTPLSGGNLPVHVRSFRALKVLQR